MHLHATSARCSALSVIHHPWMQEWELLTLSVCRFHLGQSMWRKIQTLWLSNLYKDKNSDIGKWLTLLFFFFLNDFSSCFVDEMMVIAPDEETCHQFADYMLQTYVAQGAKFPPQLWTAVQRQQWNVQQWTRINSRTFQWTILFC